MSDIDLYSSKTADSIRALSSFEHLLWLMDQNSPMHAILAARVRGKTTIAQWEVALEAARLRHPLWSSSIQSTENAIPHFHHLKNVKIPLRVEHQERLEGWEEQIALELSLAFDALNGPLVRAVLVHSEKGCMFILSAHHSIADGMSLAYSIRDILEAVSGKELSPLAPHVSQEEAFGLPMHVDSEGDSSVPVSKGLSFVELYRAKTPALPTVKSLQLSSGVATALRRRAHEKGTTVHGAMNAAIAIAATRTSHVGKKDKLHICSTINNRQFLGMPEDCTIFFTAWNVPFERVDSNCFWELGQGAKSTLTPGQSAVGVRSVLGAIHNRVRPGMDVRTGADLGAQLFMFDIHVSNLGVLPIATRYGALTLELVHGPAVLLGFEGEQTVGISTVNNNICLLHSSYDPIPNLLDQVEELLLDACVPGAR